MYNPDLGLWEIPLVKKGLITIDLQVSLFFFKILYNRFFHREILHVNKNSKSLTKLFIVGEICQTLCSYIIVCGCVPWLYHYRPGGFMPFCGSLSRNSQRLNRQWFWFQSVSEDGARA